MTDLPVLKIVPLKLAEANRFVSQFHRHNRTVVGAKFAIGLLKGTELIGCAIVGRPIARLADNGKTAEILRVAIKENNPTLNSKLFARAKRICQLMGYEKIITYTLKRESQSSLKAISAIAVAELKPRDWARQKRYRATQSVYAEHKIRWEL